MGGRPNYSPCRIEDTCDLGRTVGINPQPIRCLDDPKKSSPKRASHLSSQGFKRGRIKRSFGLPGSRDHPLCCKIDWEAEQYAHRGAIRIGHRYHRQVRADLQPPFIRLTTVKPVHWCRCIARQTPLPRIERRLYHLHPPILFGRNSLEKPIAGPEVQQGSPSDLTKAVGLTVCVTGDAN